MTKPRRAEPRLERARGSLLLAVRRDGDSNVLEDLAQSGCGRLLFPARRATEPLEAVVVNTAGGLTGGDRFEVTARIEADAAAVVTTQACEKVYRSSGGNGRMAVALSVARGATLHWLPQETILFDGSRLDRKLGVDIAPDGVFVAAEAFVLGRAAMGEVLRDAWLRDSWRIRRAGRLVFAEETACGGAWQTSATAKAALGNDAVAFATLLRVGPGAEAFLAKIRAQLASHSIDAGASVVDDLLVVRLLAKDALALRQAMLDVMESLTGAPPPRVWSI